MYWKVPEGTVSPTLIVGAIECGEWVRVGSGRGRGECTGDGCDAMWWSTAVQRGSALKRALYGHVTWPGGY